MYTIYCIGTYLIFKTLNNAPIIPKLVRKAGLHNFELLVNITNIYIFLKQNNINC